MICRGCNLERKPIKMHIIPESFFREIKADDSQLRMYTNAEGKHNKRSPIGVYDEKVLCADCEKKFQIYDAYADKLLIKSEPTEEIYIGKKAGFLLKNIDLKLLKLFFMSILWRASISKQDFYAKINLGNKLEEKLKNLIWNEDLGDTHDFSFVLAKFDKGDVKTIFDPHPERWDNLKYYRFYLGDYILYIKADSQKTPSDWEKFIPTDNTLVVVSRGEIKDSNEFKIIKSVLRPQDSKPTQKFSL